MGLRAVARSLFPRWLQPPRGPGGPAQPPSAVRPDPERAIERLSDDEALRGELTDEGYGALLSVVANLAVARAERYPSTDELYLALRGLLAGAVTAAERAEPAAILSSLAPPLLSPDEQAQLARVLRVEQGGADAAAVAIARALAAATGVEGPP